MLVVYIRITQTPSKEQLLKMKTFTATATAQLLLLAAVCFATASATGGRTANTLPVRIVVDSRAADEALSNVEGAMFVDVSVSGAPTTTLEGSVPVRSLIALLREASNDVSPASVTVLADRAQRITITDDADDNDVHAATHRDLATLETLLDDRFDIAAYARPMHANSVEAAIAAAELAGQRRKHRPDAGGDDKAATGSLTPFSDETFDEYYHYDELTDLLNDLAATFSDIMQVISLGQSVQGRELWAVRLSDNVDQDEAGEPWVKYVGNMHGDETVGRQMPIYWLEYLLQYYTDGSDQQVVDLLDNTVVYIVPSMNPDGFELDQRENANGVDLNRNFPDQFDYPNFDVASPPPPDFDGREVETQALMTFITDYETYAPWTISANFHGGSMVANYAYDGTASGLSVYSASPDDDVFIHIAKTYSENHGTMSESKEFEDGITNGAAWYVLYGGMQDFNYLWSGCLEITVEMNNVKYPPAQTLGDFWSDNQFSMPDYLEQGYKLGVRGRVISSTGAPVAAYVTVDDRETWVRTHDKTDGGFYRILVAGDYQIQAYCANDSSIVSSTTSITVPEDQDTQVQMDDIVLDC